MSRFIQGRQTQFSWMGAPAWLTKQITSLMLLHSLAGRRIRRSACLSSKMGNPGGDRCLPCISDSFVENDLITLEALAGVFVERVL